MNDETRHNIPDEISELSVPRTHFDRQPHIHHKVTKYSNSDHHMVSGVSNETYHMVTRPGGETYHTYVLEFGGIYFSCFLFIKLIVDLIVMILRHMEINCLTGASLGFGKTLLSASNNSFSTSVLTSIPKLIFCKRWNPKQGPQK